MPRSNYPSVSPTGLLDREAPIITRFDDGAEVSTWMNIIRAGGYPPVDLLDQLEAAGWQHISIARVMEILDKRKRGNIGYASISSTLARNKGCELEVEITDNNGRLHQVALCRNEFTLLHGHTVNPRGPERRARLKMASIPGVPGGLLLAMR